MSELNAKDIKKTLKILGIVLLSTLLFFAIVLALLTSNRIQNLIAQLVTSELSASLGTNVQIGNIDYELFNKVLVQDVCIQDQRKDTLLFVDDLYAYFSFWGFFKGEIVFYRTEINGVYANVFVDKTGKTNFSFLLDSFKQEEKKSFGGMVQLKDITLNKSALRFKKEDAKPHYRDVFSAEDVYITDLNAVLSLNHFSLDSLDAQIKHFSFNEQSGFALSDFQAHLIATPQAAIFPTLSLRLPHSEIITDGVTIRYDSIGAAMQDIANNVVWDVPLRKASVQLGDLGPLAPALRKIEGIALLTAHVQGSIANLQLDAFDLLYNNEPLLSGVLDINGLPVLNETFLYAEVTSLNFTKNKVQDFIADMIDAPFVLSDNLNSLGNVKFTGTLTGFLTDLVAYGLFTTKLGSISTDILLKSDDKFEKLSFGGIVKTNRFKLGTLLNNKDLGTITFNIRTKGSSTPTEKLHGTIKAQISSIGYRNYLYKDIQIDGAYSTAGFDGNLTIDDENLAFQFNGLVDFTLDKPLLNFNLDLERLNVNALNLTEKYPDSNLALNATVNLIGTNLDEMDGYAVIEQIEFKNGAENLLIEQILATATTTNEHSYLSIQSDYINAIASGKYKFSALSTTIQKIALQYLPMLIPQEKHEKIRQTPSYNQMELDVYLKNLADITTILELPVHLPEISMIKAVLDEPKNSFDIRMGFPLININNMAVNDLSLRCDNVGNKINLTTYLEWGKKNDKKKGLIKLEAQNNIISTQIDWANSATIRTAGLLKTDVSFASHDSEVRANVHIHPSQITITDSIWNLQASDIQFRTDSTIHIRDFNFGSTSQFMQVNGVVGRNETDSVHVNMKDLKLGYFLSFTSFNSILQFDGNVTANGYLYSLLNHPMFDAKVLVENATMNGALLGDLNAQAQWDRETQGVMIHAASVENQDTVLVLDGVIESKTDTLDLKIKTNGVNLAFINFWTGNIVQNLAGRGYGDVHVYGKLKQKTTFVEAKVLAKDAGLSLDMLGTRYFFTDTITMNRKSIDFKNINITDKEGNKALLNGTLAHNGSFQDLKYNINVNCTNLIGMDTQIKDNDFFFGKVYATGRITINGNGAETAININATARPNSKFNISLGSASVASDNEFITFVNKDAPLEEDAVAVTKPSSSVVKLMMQIDVTPDLALQLIIDPKTGDMITAKGNGNMRFEYDTQANIKLFGSYTIESGLYLFTLQEVLRKEFKIDNGSNITWTGDPFNAQVNLRALYSLTASLKDLMGSEANALATSRTSVPVNCVLHLTDQLMSPDIKFDIDLPNSEDGVKQQVKNIINTDEMMNRQIIYLLLLNKFYTPEYLQNSTAAVGTGEVYSLLASTLTTQINGWISKLTQDFSFGFNMRTDGGGAEAVQEFETEFLYQPNSRIVINGKLGYRDDDVADNKFTGDVDFEYLLNASGKLRAKAYTHTVDKYSLKTAQTQQGVGLLYKEDFNTIGELLHSYWENITSIFTSKEKKQKKEKKKNEK